MQSRSFIPLLFTAMASYSIVSAWATESTLPSNNIQVYSETNPTAEDEIAMAKHCLQNGDKNGAAKHADDAVEKYSSQLDSNALGLATLKLFAINLHRENGEDEKAIALRDELASSVVKEGSEENLTQQQSIALTARSIYQVRPSPFPQQSLNLMRSPTYDLHLSAGSIRSELPWANDTILPFSSVGVSLGNISDYLRGITMLPTMTGNRDYRSKIGNRHIDDKAYQKALNAAQRVTRYTVGVQKDGILESSGFFATKPQDINELFNRVKIQHDRWLKNDSKLKDRHIVIFLHGGLTGQTAALANCQSHIAWWEANRIFPVYFIWHTGPGEILRDNFRSQPQPYNVLNIDTDADKQVPSFIDGLLSLIPFDACMEYLAKSPIIFNTWKTMKDKAMEASAATVKLTDSDWNTASSLPANSPAGSLFISRLAKYVHENPRTKIHIVGHSAGSIFAAGLMQACEREKLKIASLTFLAPAIRVSNFHRFIFPLLTDSTKFTVFNLNDDLERKDECAIHGLGYHHSLLYLVSRNLEKADDTSSDIDGEVPILGMTKFGTQKMSFASPTLEEGLAQKRGFLYSSPCASPLTGRTGATSHGGFADDETTMTSIARIITNKTNVHEYDKSKWFNIFVNRNYKQ